MLAWIREGVDQRGLIREGWLDAGVDQRGLIGCWIRDQRGLIGHEAQC
jgi:hypothetical protein